MNRSTLIVSIFCLVASFATTATALDCIDPAARVQNSPSDVVFADRDVVYFMRGSILVIGDTFDVDAPVELGSVDLGATVHDMVVDDDVAYLATGDYGFDPGALVMVDVSDPTSPAVISSFETPMLARSLAVVGDTAYLGLADISDPEGGMIQIVDVSPLTLPSEIAREAFPGWPEAVASDGIYLWLADLTVGIHLYDVLPPNDPEAETFMEVDVRDLFLQENLLYVIKWGEETSDHALKIYDVTVPETPAEVSVFPTDHPRRVEVSGEAAYVLKGDLANWIELQVVDVEPPDNPMLEDSLSRSSVRGDSFAHHLAVHRGIAHITHSKGGPWLLRAPSRGSITEAGSFQPMGLVHAVAAEGPLLAVAGGETGLQLYDAADPHHPQPLVHAPLGEYARDVALHGNYAYVASWRDGISVIDVTSRTTVAQVGPEVPYFRVVLDGNELYASYFGGSSQNTTVFDVSDPTAPVVLSELQGGVLAIVADYAYADWTDWIGRCALAVWDVSDPSNPGDYPVSVDLWSRCNVCEWPWFEHGRYYDPEPLERLFDLTVAGDFAWLALGDGGLRVLDISDPASPSGAGQLDVPGCGVFSVARIGNLALLATQSPSGVMVVDATTPDAPTELAFFPSAGFPVDVAASTGVGYSGDLTSGYSVFDLRACQGPRRPSGRVQ